MYPIIKPNIGMKEIKAILTPKPKAVETFEKKFAEKIGVKYSLAFPYGRSALYSILKALKIKNKEVLTPSYTCIVVQDAVSLSGNKPTFADINLKNFNMDINEIKNNITKKTACIIPTHMYGYTMDVEKIKKEIRKSILVIEDACLALLAEKKGKRVGTLGDMAFFSFNISKHITTFNGGMLVTNNKEYYEKLKKYRDNNLKKPSKKKRIKIIFLVILTPFLYNKIIYGILHGIRQKWSFLRDKTKMENWDFKTVEMPGDFLEQMTKSQAKIGISQLQKLDSIVKNKKKIAKYYSKYLNGKFIHKPLLEQNATYSHYTIRVPEGQRDEYRKELFSKGINTGMAMNYSCPHTQYYNSNSKYDEKFSKSAQISEEIINLPAYPSLTEKNIRMISRIINQIEERTNQTNKFKPKNFWEKKYRGKESSRIRYKTNNDLSYGIFKREAGVSDMKVLDLGCGYGGVSERLAKDGNEVVGIDISKNSIEISKKRAKEKELDINYKAVAAQKINFKNDTFDVICAMATLQHILDDEEWEEAANRAYEVLKPGGKIFILESAPTSSTNEKFFYKRERTYKDQLRMFERVGFKHVKAGGAVFTTAKLYWVPKKILPEIMHPFIHKLLLPVGLKIDLFLSRFRFLKFFHRKYMIFEKPEKE